MFGERVLRSEDERFLAGRGRYVANLPIEGALHAVFVRSMMPHARIVGFDPGVAAAMPEVAGVFDAGDLSLAPQPPGGILEDVFARPVLARDVVRFAGEPVAVVVADTLARAMDGAEEVVVSYDPLPAVTDPEAALAPGAPLLFPSHGSNEAHSSEVGFDTGDPLEGAEVVARGRFVNQRLAPSPLETNAFAAVPESGGRLTVWVSSQIPFDVRGDVADALGLPKADVRVIAPDVGGAFGSKLTVYPEYLALASIAVRLGRPVRWSETRSESMVALTHGRGQVQHVELGAKRDGELVGLAVHLVADMGAYPGPGSFLPSNTYQMASGPYRIPRIAFRTRLVVTNTTPTAPYRGAGRPEATAMLERAMDVLAGELGMDPVDLRRRNLIRPDEFPYDTGTGALYDSGDYERALDEALRIAGYDTLREEQAARRERSDARALGIGVGCYAEITSFGGREYASVEVADDRSILVRSGLSPHGQGHETSLAQIASSALGVPFERVRVVHSDTGAVARGEGTWASRSLQLGGSAVLRACEGLARKGAAAGGLEPGMSEEADFDQKDSTFPFGTHVAVVEVDVETGKVELQRHIAVDDCGRVLNPMLVEGQVHGGAAQGIAQALFEEVLYDAAGNPSNANLAEYGMPAAPDLPPYETALTETPSPLNPLGAKGIGESATIGAPPAAQNAVVDALSHLGVRHVDMPATPERVWRAIRDAREAGPVTP